MFKMKALGTDRMDENSMVEYIVDGLPADKASKTTLYEATSYDELLDKLRVFKLNEKVRQDKSGKKHVKHSSGNKTSEINNKKSSDKKCFSCGVVGHTKYNCPELKKGKKCFNCDMYGHIATACRLPKRQENAAGKSTDVMIVENSPDTMMIPTSANGVQLSALLDTGSPYTFMDKALISYVYHIAQKIKFL